MFQIGPAVAQEEPDVALVVPVLFVTGSQSRKPHLDETCRQALIGEGDLLQREEAGKPFYLRKEWLAGAVGGLAGGYVGDRAGKHYLPITIAGMVGGFLAGKAMWAKFFPLVPHLAPDTDVPPEIFLRDRICDKRVLYTYDEPHYRVVYRFGDDELSADVSFDPGEALFVDTSGKVLGPARVRID